MDKGDMLTLRQKWSGHWEKRNEIFSPSKQTNFMGVVFFWIFTFSLMYTSLWILIPQLFDTDSQFWFQFFVYFIFIESVVNWVLTYSQRSKLTASHLSSCKSDERDTWRQCMTCQITMPPRTHHCKICNICVLKRDHHCFFTGTCVGFQNQRNFIVFVFYIAIGSAYGVVLLAMYLNDIWPVFNIEYCYNYLPFVPFWKFIFGHETLAHLLLLVQFYICILMWIVAAWFFFLEMYTVIVGITWHEAEKGIRKYQGEHVWANFRSVFGPYWLVQFVFPIPSAQEEDGVNWVTKKGSKNY